MSVQEKPRCASCGTLLREEEAEGVKFRTYRDCPPTCEKRQQREELHAKVFARIAKAWQPR